MVEDFWFFFILKLLLYFLFFKYKFIYFNWMLITLRYCIGFAIHQHESTTGNKCSLLSNIFFNSHNPHFLPL